LCTWHFVTDWGWLYVSHPRCKRVKVHASLTMNSVAQ
jgi:hypothetical protein